MPRQAKITEFLEGESPTEKKTEKRFTWYGSEEKYYVLRHLGLRYRFYESFFCAEKTCSHDVSLGLYTETVLKHIVYSARRDGEWGLRILCTLDKTEGD